MPTATTPRPTNDGILATIAAHAVHEEYIENEAEVTYSGAFALMTALKPTFTPPTSNLATGRVTIDRCDGSELRSWFFGTGADGATFQAMLVVWRRLRARRPSPLYGSMNVEPLMWVPRPLVVLDGLLSATIGADSASGPPGLVASTHRVCDTLTLSANGNRSLNGNGVRFGGPVTPDDTIADVAVDIEGGAMYEWHLRCGTATGINVVTRPLSRSY